MLRGVDPVLRNAVTHWHQELLRFFRRLSCCRGGSAKWQNGPIRHENEHLAINLHKYLIQMPLPVRVCAHLLNPFPADFSGKQRAKTVPPISNRFVANIDAALVQKIFYVSQRQRKTNIQHDGVADNFGAAMKALEWVCFNHVDRLRNHPPRLNSNPSDKTVQD